MDGKTLVLLLASLVPGLIIRFYLAPYTCGSDIPQFAGFADSFLRHGLEFFRYSDGARWSEEGWPYGWPYVYGPAFIILLGLVRLLAPSPVKHFWRGNAYYVYAPVDWIVALKSVYILFDVLAAYAVYCLVYRATGRRGLAWASSLLYFYNPMTIYISSIYGMFDQIPFFFTIAGLYHVVYGGGGRNTWLGPLLLGLGIAFKPTMIYPVAFIALYLLLRHHFLKGIAYSAPIILVPIIIFLPFITAAPDGLWIYLKAVRQVTSPTYTSPVVYTFNGITSLAFYAHEHTGFDFRQVTVYWPLFFAPLILLVLLGFLEKRDPIVYSSLAYIAYTATYWRVNFQYLVPTLGFTLIVLAVTHRRSTGLLALLVYFLIALWPVMFPVSWWARVHIEEPGRTVIGLLDTLSLMVFEQVYYVYYSIALTTIQILLVVHEAGKEAVTATARLVNRAISLSWLRLLTR